MSASIVKGNHFLEGEAIGADVAIGFEGGVGKKSIRSSSDSSIKRSDSTGNARGVRRSIGSHRLSGVVESSIFQVRLIIAAQDNDRSDHSSNSSYRKNEQNEKRIDEVENKVKASEFCDEKKNGSKISETPDAKVVCSADISRRGNLSKLQGSEYEHPVSSSHYSSTKEFLHENKKSITNRKTRRHSMDCNVKKFQPQKKTLHSLTYATRYPKTSRRLTLQSSSCQDFEDYDFITLDRKPTVPIRSSDESEIQSEILRSRSEEIYGDENYLDLLKSHSDRRCSSVDDLFEYNYDKSTNFQNFQNINYFEQTQGGHRNANFIQQSSAQQMRQKFSRRHSLESSSFVIDQYTISDHTPIAPNRKVDLDDGKIKRNSRCQDLELSWHCTNNDKTPKSKQCFSGQSTCSSLTFLDSVSYESSCHTAANPSPLTPMDKYFKSRQKQECSRRNSLESGTENKRYQLHSYDEIPNFVNGCRNAGTTHGDQTQNLSAHAKRKTESATLFYDHSRIDSKPMLPTRSTDETERKLMKEISNHNSQFQDTEVSDIGQMYDRSYRRNSLSESSLSYYQSSGLDFKPVIPTRSTDDMAGKLTVKSNNNYILRRCNSNQDDQEILIRCLKLNDKGILRQKKQDEFSISISILASNRRGETETIKHQREPFTDIKTPVGHNKKRSNRRHSIEVCNWKHNDEKLVESVDRCNRKNVKHESRVPNPNDTTVFQRQPNAHHRFSRRRSVASTECHRVIHEQDYNHPLCENNSIDEQKKRSLFSKFRRFLLFHTVTNDYKQ